ncbi:hypothetical protein D3C86_1401410 [compost metagenome]
MLKGAVALAWSQRRVPWRAQRKVSLLKPNRTEARSLTALAAVGLRSPSAVSSTPKGAVRLTRPCQALKPSVSLARKPSPLETATA